MSNNNPLSNRATLALPCKTALAAGLAMSLLGADINIALAATQTVTNCDDIGPGSLRQAVSDSADMGSVIFQPNLGCNRITLTSGVINVTVANLTIDGPGEKLLTIDGNASDRVLIHSGDGTLTINGLTITNGKTINSARTTASGGCIRSTSGNIVLSGSTVSGCVVQANNGGGGAIYVHGRLSMTNSTISGNTVNAFDATAGFLYGGGIQTNTYLSIINSTIQNNSVNNSAATFTMGGGVHVSSDSARVLISRSTISGNRAKWGGGLFINTGGLVAINNSTISGNSGRLTGGGISISAPSGTTGRTIIDSTTIASNTITGVLTGGLSVDDHQLSLNSSIIANNTNTNVVTNFPVPSDLSFDNSSFGISSNNLIFAPDSTIKQITVPPDTIVNTCPQLEPLANNGGPTQTHALHHTSPAIDKGINTSNFTFDQRDDGFSRTFGTAVDIGAYEWQGGPDEQIFHSRFESGCNE